MSQRSLEIANQRPSSRHLLQRLKSESGVGSLRNLQPRQTLLMVERCRTDCLKIIGNFMTNVVVLMAQVILNNYGFQEILFAGIRHTSFFHRHNCREDSLHSPSLTLLSVNYFICKILRAPEKLLLHFHFLNII